LKLGGGLIKEELENVNSHALWRAQEPASLIGDLRVLPPLGSTGKSLVRGSGAVPQKLTTI
jgi:hypothetical protein